MMMGIGLALATLGAILRYAIHSTGDEFDLPTVGLILMIVGAIAFLTGVGLEYMQRRGTIVRPSLPTTVLPPAPPVGSPTAGVPLAGQPPAGQPPTHPH